MPGLDPGIQCSSPGDAKDEPWHDEAAKDAKVEP